MPEKIEIIFLWFNILLFISQDEEFASHLFSVCLCYWHSLQCILIKCLTYKICDRFKMCATIWIKTKGKFYNENIEDTSKKYIASHHTAFQCVNRMKENETIEFMTILDFTSLSQSPFYFIWFPFSFFHFVIILHHYLNFQWYNIMSILDCHHIGSFRYRHCHWNYCAGCCYCCDFVLLIQ